ncbi:MAG: c-type cytochrome biogenesis protein CcsB [Propionibacteriaceae bacterium]|nr:c-type cytochrome biogenesis protein CcsB [Propionibacteriaceae bacterium]
MLEFAEYLVTAATVLVVVSLLCHIAVVTSTNRATPAEVSRRAKVSVGSPGEAGREAAHHTPPARKQGLAWYAAAFEVVALVLLTAYLGIRMSVTGHGPFANQHEFAVSFTWGILLANLVFEVRYRVQMLSLAVLPVAGALLVYGMSLDTGVKPLIPALQNNLLLTLHVGFAILAYGAACVSFGAAVLFLVRPFVKRLKLPSPETLDDLGYRAAVVTFPLLTIMIVLGSVWASTAWGRYWGWDPKETAAFVTWLLYGAFLHARVVRDWRGTRAAWLLIVGFIAVLFAYFGNHFFGGLHSYA